MDGKQTSTERRTANVNYKHLKVCRTILHTVQIVSVQMLLFALLCPSFSILIMKLYSTTQLSVIFPIIAIKILLCFHRIFIIFLSSFESQPATAALIFNFTYEALRCVVLLYQLSSILEIFNRHISCNFIRRDSSPNSRRTTNLKFLIEWKQIENWKTFLSDFCRYQ